MANKKSVKQHLFRATEIQSKSNRTEINCNLDKTIDTNQTIVLIQLVTLQRAYLFLHEANTIIHTTIIDQKHRSNSIIVV